MPFYDYQCTECSHEVHDIYRKITDNITVYKCDKCGKEMKLHISSTFFELKGKGWAKDNYSSSDKK